MIDSKQDNISTGAPLPLNNIIGLETSLNSTLGKQSTINDEDFKYLKNKWTTKCVKL